MHEATLWCPYMKLRPSRWPSRHRLRHDSTHRPAADARGNGPVVVFDRAAPLPKFPPERHRDVRRPTRRTGRRINVSSSPDGSRTRRATASRSRGLGHLRPISVSFARHRLENVRAHAARRLGYTNDPVYVRTATGVPALLDAAAGASRVIRDLDNYYPNDPRVTEQNVLPRRSKKARACHKPTTSFARHGPDGTLDHPNTPRRCARGRSHPRRRRSPSFYERDQHAAPQAGLPLAKDEYAVVLTDRSPTKRTARALAVSVFASARHGRSAPNDPRGWARANYYGNKRARPAHVAFA
jgi:hypothetical protein